MSGIEASPSMRVAMLVDLVRVPRYASVALR
jgi:hypothetical protein